MTEELKKALTKKQVEILEFYQRENPRHIILEGAIRSGKTILNILLFMIHAESLRNRNVKLIITGTSIASIKRNVLDEIERLFDIPTNLNQKNEFKLFGNTVICFGTDKSDSYKVMKGFTAHGWLGNEITESHKNSIDQAFKRCSGKGSKVFWDTNPADPQHFVKEGFINRNGCRLSDGSLNIASFHFILDDNDKLDPDYIQSVKESTPKGMWYDRDILGMWVAAQGIIYTDFNYEEHVIEKAPDGLKDYFAGMDWGWTHKGVHGLYGMDSLGTCYRILEIAESEKGIDWWKGKVLELYKKYGSFPVYCPPDRPENKQEYRQAGINAVDANTAVFEGITWCAEQYKKKNAFKIVRDDNVNLLSEIPWYRWKEGAAKEEPIKERDDSCDSDRYARFTHLAHSNIAIIRRYENYDLV
jgi:PBSX family phage terminase large subunit